MLITGASGQLGTAVTHFFLNKGYKVIATLHKEEELKNWPSETNFQTKVVNLSDSENAGLFVSQAISEHEHIDAALLLAGGFAMGGISETTIELVKKQIGINFDTAYNIVQPLFQHMVERNYGRIILIGSRPALNASYGKNMIAYSISKAMLVTLADLLNETAKGSNVTVSVVAPGTIDTEVNRKSMPQADTSNWVKPETLAEIFDFICSDSASVLKGTVLKAYG